MSEHASRPQQQKPESKHPRRSPVERAIVWGVIALLAVAALYQASGRLGYSRTLSAWNAALEAAELDAAENADAPRRFTLSQAASLASGFPSKSPLEKQGQWHVMTYRWGSLWQDYEIALKCLPGDDPEVILIDTGEAPEADSIPRPTGTAARPSKGSPPETAEREKRPSPRPAEETKEPEPGPDAPRRGALAGFEGFVIGSWDQDRDGKISREESPEQLREYFDRLDQNGDGFLDGPEVAAAPALEELQQGESERAVRQSNESEGAANAPSSP